MRITHLNLSPEFRGGEYQTLALVRALAPAVESRLVVRADGPFEAALRSEDGLDVVPVHSRRAALRALRGTPLVHVHEGRSVLLGAVSSLCNGTPYIVTRRVPRIPKRNWFSRFGYRRAWCVVGVSGAVSAGMRAYDPDLQVRTVHDCVRPLRADRAAADRLRAGQGDSIVVGHVGELDDVHKGQRLLIEAARTLRDASPAVTFWLIGEGRDRGALEAAAAGLPNLRLLGRVDDIADYYAAMDIFAFPSRFEALGSSILEAFSFALPVIASDVDGIPEIVQDGVNGMLFRQGDAAALAGQIALLAGDPALRERLGRQAGEDAARYSAARMAEQYLAIYREVARQ